MNSDKSQQNPAQGQSQPITKKSLPVGLFAGMNIKKKTAQPVEPQPPLEATQQLDVSIASSNKKSQNSSLFQADSKIEEAKEAPEKIISEANEVEREAVDSESKKSKKIPFFKNMQAKKAKPTQNESGDDFDLFQFSGAKPTVTFESDSKVKLHQTYERNNEEEILDFDMENFKEVALNPKASDDQNDLSLNTSRRRDNSTGNQDQNSFDFLGSSKKKPMIHESSFDRSQQDVPLTDIISSNGQNIVHSSHNREQTSIDKNKADNEKGEIEKVEEVPRPAKKTFGFIKKTKEKTQTKDSEPEQPSKQFESKGKISRLPRVDQNRLRFEEQTRSGLVKLCREDQKRLQGKPARRKAVLKI